MITVIIDELTPCLKESETENIVETEVIRIRRKSILKNFNSRNGWYTNWASLADDNEIYALVLKGTNDIQGMVALSGSDDFKAVHIAWMCAAPHNNPEIAEKIMEVYDYEWNPDEL